ncbi:N-acetyltransferase [Marinilactibacillus sp. Marseille-P9653]|uniref:N-acetyltransferase n=1 Tax=Marinilactibacillus sp. Marseille-P9653 TaxID=2866583 RepID=UPI001CE4296A|nr:N-acetyltransferase [Marinilactibacillus sp. Marseille-P9653]
MHIRENYQADLDYLVNIWYEASIDAHDFIAPDYWREQQVVMKEKYLPLSETYVISEGNGIVGFVSLVDDYLAALFIDLNVQGEGYGKALLNFVKDQRDFIQLTVYKKNQNAVDFYLKNHFSIKEQSIDQQTSEEEYVMTWFKE